jgi:hypothetical protein
MIFASINGIPGVGFAEPCSDEDGAGEHRGKIRLSAANAKRLRRLIDEGTTLVYYGPAWAEQRWQVRSFPLHAAEFQTEREDFFVVQFVERNATTKMMALTSPSLIASAPPPA